VIVITGNAVQSGLHFFIAVGRSAVKEGCKMGENCWKCGARLESSWKFCPLCGAGSVPETHQGVDTHTKIEKAPIRGGVSGFVIGLIMAPVLIIYGTLICLMVGPWMVLGIPMIVAGICAPIIGPFVAVGAVRGKCPWCGTKIASLGPLDAFYCYACSKRIAVHKREMVRAE
jgi:hypothetical protein